jgi:hypothetical protein
MTTTALCPTRAKVSAAMTMNRRSVIEWRPTASGAMRADLAPYGKGVKLTWSVAISLTKDGRPATGRDAAATLLISVALDTAGRWEARLAPGQDEGERPLTLAGADGGYLAAQAAIAGAMADYAVKTIGKRRGYVPVALRSPLGGGDVVSL